MNESLMKKFYHISINEAVSLLNKQENKFIEVLKDRTMSVEYFVPKNIDEQQPHKKDELYIIASGSARFYRDGETIMCGQGDVIFVPAKMEHRFINFSKDFATWVIFYGDDVV